MEIIDYIKKNKKLTFVAIAVMVLSLPFVINQILKRQDVRQRAQTAPSISFSFSPSSKNVAVNEQFDVDLIMNAGVNDIGALEFTINYPSSTLEFVGDTPLSTYTIANRQIGSGAYKVTLLNITSTKVTGDGVKVLTLRFKGLSNGSASLKLDPSSLQVTAAGSDQFVPVDSPNSIEGSYVVGQPSNGATLYFTPASNSYQTGDLVTVYANVNAGQTINAVQFDVNFPSNLLSYVSVSKDAFGVDVPIVISSGKLTLAYGSITPLSGDLIVAKITFQALAPGNANLTFSNGQALSNVNNQNVLTGSSGASYTITGTSVTPSVPVPTATNAPSPTLTLTPTPTRTPTPTIPAPTATLTPTLIPNQTGIFFKIKIPGIGLTAGDLLIPVHSTRTARVEIYDASNNRVVNTTTVLTYSSSAGQFQGTLNLGSSLTSGSYLATIKLANSLSKRIPGIISLTQGSIHNAVPVVMISGDLFDDNELDIADYTNLIACDRGEVACTPEIMSASDLNDDGKIDDADQNIILRGFGNRKGE